MEKIEETYETMGVHDLNTIYESVERESDESSAAIVEPQSSPSPMPTENNNNNQDQVVEQSVSESSETS